MKKIEEENNGAGRMLAAGDSERNLRNGVVKTLFGAWWVGELPEGNAVRLVCLNRCMSHRCMSKTRRLSNERPPMIGPQE